MAACATHTGERDLLRMEYRSFYNAFIAIPAQSIKTGRRIICRLLVWNPHQHIFSRLYESLRK